VISSKSFVDALYTVLLGRPADPQGLDEKVSRLDAKLTSPPGLISEIIASPEFRANLPAFLARSAHDMPFVNSVSQYGEINLLVAHLLDEAVAEKFVIDVGARGRERSNSWDLMRHLGWAGLLIEANPRLVPQIRQEFDGLNCTIVNCAISDFSGEAQLTIGANDDVSSLNPEAAEAWGATRGAVRVEVRRLPDVLQEHGVPWNAGLLSLDIEGEDLKVLADLVRNSDYRPKYVIVEASYDFATRSLEDLPVPDRVREDYMMIGQTRANLILKRIDRTSIA
jgi:FkbM family methyltransferase